MTAEQIIDEIEGLDANAQARVIDYALNCARRRQMSATELSKLASALPGATAAEAAALRKKLEQGFYGGGSNA